MSWQRGESPMPLLVLRLLLTALALAILAWSLFENACSPYWLIYLTSWGILLVVATTLSGLVVSLVFMNRKSFETSVLPWYVSIYWLVFNVTVTIAVTISALYWLLLHNPALRKFLGKRLFMLDVAAHAVIPCIAMIDLLMSRTPVKLAHIYQPVLFGFTYVLFTLIYFVAGCTDINGNPFIYGVLNWQYPKRSTILVMLSMIVLVIIYLALWFLAFIRDQISLALLRRSS